MFGSIKRVLAGIIALVCFLVWSMVSNPMIVNAKDNGLHLGQLKDKKDNGLHLGELKDKLDKEYYKEYYKEGNFELQFGMQLFFNILSQVSDILGVEEQNIIDKLKDGKSLAEAAADYGVSETALLEKIKNKVEEAINSIIAFGVINEDQASELIKIFTKDLKQILDYKFFIFPGEHSDSDLKAPVGLTAEARSDTEIYLDWDSVAGASSYYVYRAASYSGAYTRIAAVTTSSYTDDNLKEATTYYYKVKAQNSSDTTGYSSIVHATTKEDSNINLKAPAHLTATAESDTEILLDWDSVSRATSYYVYRATSYSGVYTRIAIVSTSSYVDDDLEADTLYFYKVKAHNSNDTSDYSLIVHAQTYED